MELCRGAALGSITQTNDAGALKTIAVQYSGKFMIRDNKGRREYLIAKAPHLAVLLQELLIQKKKHIYIAK